MRLSRRQRQIDGIKTDGPLSDKGGFNQLSVSK